MTTRSRRYCFRFRAQRLVLPRSHRVHGLGFCPRLKGLRARALSLCLLRSPLGGFPGFFPFILNFWMFCFNCLQVRKEQINVESSLKNSIFLPFAIFSKKVYNFLIIADWNEVSSRCLQKSARQRVCAWALRGCRLTGVATLTCKKGQEWRGFHYYWCNVK